MQPGRGLPRRLGNPKSVSFSDVSDGMSGQRRYSDDEFDRALRELAEGTAGDHGVGGGDQGEQSDLAGRFQ